MINKLLVIISLLLLFSCLIEKRRHTRGYHVEWNKRITKQKPIETSTNHQPTTTVNPTISSSPVIEETKIGKTKHSVLSIPKQKSNPRIKTESKPIHHSVRKNEIKPIYTNLIPKSNTNPFTTKKAKNKKTENNGYEGISINTLALIAFMVLGGLLIYYLISIELATAGAYVAIALLCLALFFIMEELGLGEIFSLVLEILFLITLFT